MAEFKLGRIRFVWKGDWASDFTYYKDDVISFGGKVYICVLGHSSSADFFTDLDIIPSKWNLVSDGQSWKGDWQPQTSYIYDDIVKYGARLYICKTNHTSAEDSTVFIENDLGFWDIFAEGLDWKGNWSTETNYKLNDFVKYGGSTYVCIETHISSATEADGLEVDLDKWQAFNNGFDYKSSWAPFVRYKLNDVVRYGAGLWINVVAHTSTTNFADNSDKFEKFVDGFQYENEWEVQVQYQPGDVVQYGGNQYISKTDNTAIKPIDSTTDWDIFSEGLRFLGDWNEDSSNFEYLVGDVVRLGGFTYRCILDNQNQQPPNATYWSRLNSGFEWRGEWIDDQEYVEGDVVRFGDNSYVCIKAHISEGDDYSSLSTGAEGSRPDSADSGQYWSILAVGTEQSVLTTTGDMVYYSGSAPTRLPIGRDGQVLTANADSLPEWTFLGAVEDVYYVAEHGKDQPAPEYGQTIDRPWKSIRYATEQVENGAKNPDARTLLELNRKFIQREIVEWTDFQIAENNTPFTSSFEYNSAKCERDMGYIVDALIWDITHGGNVRTREAALKYVNEASNFYTLGQEAETVASINYGLTVIEAVLNQTAPSVNYQATNGDNSTAIVDQYFDSALRIEDSVYPEIQSLVKIITDAITAGNDANIPARLIRNTLIKVSTGRYYETLPIIVPAECCILGDELRSTNVSPRKASNSTLTPKQDFKYSSAALERLEEIVGDIVTGAEVIPTVGNTEIQSREWPYAETDWVAPQVTKLARNIRKRIDIGLGEKRDRILKETHEMGSRREYGVARDLNLLNKDFIKEEIIAFIADQYPTIKYSKTKCRQDVGFIIDSVVYDLIYGGNWQSINAGLAYFNGTNGVLQIAASEKAATLAAYTRLRELMQTVARNIVVTPTYQTTVSQYTGFEGASITVSNTIDDLFDAIDTIIDQGPDNAPATVFPTTAGVSSTLVTESTNIDNIKSTVQELTIDFINANFGSFKYNSAKCRRDLTNIITDLAFDVALGTNYNATFNGIAYQRPNNAYNLEVQRVETVGAIRRARDLLSVELGDGNSNDRLRAGFDEIVNIINDGTLGEAMPGDGVVDALVLPTPAGVDQNRLDAKNNLQANIEFMKADVIAYITQNYGGLTYDSAKCARDVEYIVNAQSYDILYGGTMATTRIAESYFVNGTIQVEGQTVETAAAYNHLASIMAQIVQESSVTAQPGNTELQTTLGSPASATEAAEVQANVELISDVIDGTTTLAAVQAARTFPSVTWADAEFQTAKSDIDTARPQVILDTIQYITDTYNDFNYNHAKCSRDLGLIIDAARYDWMLGSNFASMQAAYSYLRQPSSKVVGDQKTATIAANEFARQYILNNNIITDSTAIAGLNNTWEWIDDTIFAGSAEGGNNQVDDEEVYNAVRQLELNKEFIVKELTSHVNNKFRDTVVRTEDSSANIINITDTSWLEINMPIRFVNPEDSTNAVANAGLDIENVYYVTEITGPTSFTCSLTPGGFPPVLTVHEEEFFVETTYEYNEDICARDIRTYIDAIKWDLVWPQEWKREYTDGVTLYRPGCYKTRLAARYYVNSVIGSQEEDMYYLRNGTGLRLQTVEGLQGDLTAENEFGTSRVTAGAYASLDPGWGPDDQRVWITARSPYVQNLTTFGYAATGQRIDGALHNGGNDSIVSNDFTQVISDGIGAHILNNGRAELVSVFTYYSYIGYLAETGGRIRATNGNNSYGTYGSVAEGVDPDETPVTAIVDNSTQYNATIGLVNTNNDQLLNLEFNHAGNNYTEALIEIFGPGDNEEIVTDEFRDDSVFQARVLDSGDENIQTGGKGYVIVSNTAQAGDASSITLAATDGNLSSAYPGMKILITGGAGIGQYAIVDTYNAGTKVATVVKESDRTAGWDHMVPGTPIVNPNSTSTYEIEPAISIAPPIRTSVTSNSIPSGDYSAIHYVETSAQYTNVATLTESDGRNVTFDVTRNGSKYYLTLNAAGSGYSRLDTVTILGTSVGGATPLNDITVTLTSINPVNGSVVDFDFNGIGQKGVFVALENSNTGGAYSVDGNTWVDNSLPDAGATNVWSNLASGLVDDGSSTFKQSAVVAVSQGGPAAYSQDGINWTSVALPGTFATAGATAIAFGQITVNTGRFVAISANDSDVVYSDNGGQSWQSVASPLTGTNYTALTYGKGLFVALRANTNDTMYSEDGIIWSGGVGLPNSSWVDIQFGNGRFVAIAETGVAAYSLDGKTWVQSDLPGITSYARIAYGQGVFVVSSNAAGTAPIYSEDGINWSNDISFGGFTGSGTKSIAFGNPNRVGKFIITSNGASTEIAELRIGARAKARASVANEQIFAIRMLEPGSGYVAGERKLEAGTNYTEVGTATATSFVLDFTDPSLVEEITSLAVGTNVQYLVAGGGYGTGDVVSITSNGLRVTVTLTNIVDFAPNSGAGIDEVIYDISAEPAIAVTDPNNIDDVVLQTRVGKGALANPTFVSRGDGFISATAEINANESNGEANFLQDGSFIAVRRLSERPVSGSNIEFGNLPGRFFKLVNTVSFIGQNDGSYTAFLQISPSMPLEDVLPDGDDVTMRIRFSQVRLTGHDFLDIGTGNFDDTNYPNDVYGEPVNAPNQANETYGADGGRVFFTATDQDGNFRVGDLFSIEQATGVATLDAEAFNIAGLQELTLGEVTLGGNSASISEFSTDPFFTANSDSVVPTQRAVKAYIEAQIGGGGASLNVNSVTAGDIFIGGNQITTVSGEPITIKANVVFEGTVLGLPLAYNYFLR